ncbi:MAG: tRNA uridine-5-carboxymethylaminomethyl(34) synthesis GTPase MnmE [Pseudomonadota bacterium]|nr:tRNA uridine-5-carboxymethylaminomethyl(34) synthesis GTPase MnmE [Pseudomonadota bacterium]
MGGSDTIFALSSGPIPAGVAIVRISGPDARRALRDLTGSDPLPRIAALQTIRDRAGDPIDRAIVLFFPGPKSFTGEDVVEFQLHGSRAVVAKLFTELSQIGGLRHAEAGEFTQRAFVNGRLDLVEAEGLADLIEAETELQRRLALASAGGSVSRGYDSWRDRILHARAMIEAELDFSDEGDVPGSVSEAVLADIRALSEEIERHVAGYRRSEIIRDGFRVVIVGAPNAGKSSLLNALAARDAAIVTAEPGTTRDVIEVPLILGGTKVILADTAGLREPAGTVEAIGIDRSRGAANSADMVLLLEAPDAPFTEELGVDGEILRVANKLDLGYLDGSNVDFQVSALTGEGVGALLDAVGAAACAKVGSSSVLPFKLRHVELLRSCGHALEHALREELPLELRAEELRAAGNDLGRITGKIDAEEVLGAIFSRFCIGK